MKKFNTGHLALFITAVLFGLAFIFQRHAALLPAPHGTFIAALWFMFWRLLVAVVFLGGCLYAHYCRTHRDYGRWVYYGAIAGVFMFGGMLFQQWGLSYTSAGKSGFITGLYVVFVPLITLLGGHKQGMAIWIAVALSVAGLGGFFSIDNSVDALTAWNTGDVLTLICAVCWGAQVLWSSVAVRHCNALAFSVAQIGAVCLFTFLVLTFSGNVADLAHSDWLAYGVWDILATGIGSSALAFFLQAVGQRKVPAAHAAVIMSLESVFAMLFGWWLLDETVTGIMLLGSAFMFAGMLVAQYDEVKA